METQEQKNTLPNINLSVSFAKGHLAEVIKNIELFSKIPISFRSTTGEVVIKTDYFNGPCSIIRATETGRIKCRNTYRTIEQKTLTSNKSSLNVCYAGFIIVAAPALIRDEIVGTLLGSQILPLNFINDIYREFFYSNLLLSLGMNNEYLCKQFYKTFDKAKYINTALDQDKLIKFFEILALNFETLSMTAKSWILVKNELLNLHPELRSFLSI